MNQNKVNDIYYLDYRSYLKDKLKSIRQSHQLTQKDFAKHIVCQPAYVSRILKGQADLSLEQADATTEFLQLSDQKSEYFMLLVQYERAGRARYKDKLKKKLDIIKRKALNADQTFKASKSLSQDISSTYYSDWYYAAIHLMLTIPQIRTPKKIAAYLGLSVETVESVLDFLHKAKIVTKIGGEYLQNTDSFYLKKDSLMSQTAHRYWRLLELNSLIQPKEDDFHFSSIVTMSKKDVPLLKQKILDCIEGFRSVIKDSKEEDMFCYTFDLFSLKK